MYLVEHKKRYDIVRLAKSGTFSFYIKYIGTFYCAFCSVRVCISHSAWDFSSQKKKKKKKRPNKWRTINSLVHKIRLHGRRGKATAESFSREKLRQTPQKEGGEILCDVDPG